MAKTKKHQPAMTPEGRENQLISLAVDLAEQKLRDGTASSQIIAHYLDLAGERERLRREKQALENELLKAKTDSIRSSERSEELFREAIAAMREYQGKSDE